MTWWMGINNFSSCSITVPPWIKKSFDTVGVGKSQSAGPLQCGQREHYWQDGGRWWIVGPSFEKVSLRNNARVVSWRAPAASAWNGSQTCQWGAFRGKCWSPGAAPRWKLILQKSEITRRTWSATLHASRGTLAAPVPHFNVVDGFKLPTLIWCAVAPNVAAVVQLCTLQSGGTSCGASGTVRSNIAIAIYETAAECIYALGQDFLCQRSLISKWWSAHSLQAALAFGSLKFKV